MVTTLVAQPVDEQQGPQTSDVKEADVQAPQPTIVAPTTKNAKIKGTWTQFYGQYRYDFVDGQRYDLPLELFEYLKGRGCIYDTL